MKKYCNKNLIEDYFVIPAENLDIDNFDDFKFEFYQLEYCENCLDIPIHYIDYTSYFDDQFEIYLNHVDAIIELEDNDWYWQLKNIARYSRVS